MLPQVALEADDEIHVLRDAAGAITAHRQEMRALEQPERAGDDQIAAKAIPPQASKEKGAQILEHLNCRQDAPVNPRLDDAPMGNRTGVGDANRSADGGDRLA